MTATCHRFELSEYCDLLEVELERFVAAATDIDPDAPVPSCPGWSARDVVEHTGGLHRWAEAHVRLLSQERVRARDLELRTPSDPEEWEPWLWEGMSVLVDTLGSADPDAVVWTWGSDKHARFWGRRMLFETTIHRADLELTRERLPVIDAAVAADGIDEFLDNLPHAEYFAPKVKELQGTGERLRFSARDIDVVWTIGLFKDGLDWHHSRDEPNVRVEGSASDLLLFVYGRKTEKDAGLSSVGHPGVLERWRTNSAI